MRHASGKGPFPFYVALQYSNAKIKGFSDFCKTYTVLYPAGGIFFHQSTVRIEEPTIHTEQVIRIGNDAFKKGNRLFSGFDLRARLMIFDPAGTPGGLGIFVEYKGILNLRKRSLQPFYDLVGIDNGNKDSWHFQSISVGLVAPLALRVL